jgi:hypothetical protein
VGDLGDQRGKRGRSELFSQRRSISELTRRGPPVSDSQLGFGKAEARVRLGIGLSQGPPAVAYAVPLVNRRVGLVAPTEPEALGPRLCHPGLDFERAGSAVVDMGSPVQSISGSGGADQIGGYAIMQADSLEGLKNVLEGHPHTEWGGTIEILEFLELPGA